jgi:hypothetical protein
MKEYIEFHPGLTIVQKIFLVQALNQGRKVEIIESNSELISSKGVVWCQQTNDPGYYEGMLEKNRALGFGLVMRNLIQDVEIWNVSDQDDKDQIRDVKDLDLEEEVV